MKDVNVIKMFTTQYINTDFRDTNSSSQNTAKKADMSQKKTETKP